MKINNHEHNQRKVFSRVNSHHSYRFIQRMSFLLALLGQIPASSFAQKEKSRNSEKVSLSDIQNIIDKLSCEPSVDAIINTAIQVSVDPVRTEELAEKAKLRGWIPTLKLGVRRGQGRDQSAQLLEETDRTNFSTDDDLVLNGSISFDFTKVIFSPEEISLLREQRALVTLRENLIKELIHLYFERKRLKIELELIRSQNLQKLLRIQEVEALMNTATRFKLAEQWNCSDKQQLNSTHRKKKLD